MGLYINHTENGTLLAAIGKADSLIESKTAQEVQGPPDLDEATKSGMAVICVVENGPFDAALYCVDQNEYDVACEPKDMRPKRWLVMSRDLANTLTRNPNEGKFKFVRSS